MKNFKIWSNEEMEGLKLDYPDISKSHEFLIQKYNASWAQIITKVHKMRLCRKRIYEHTLNLTKREIINLYLDGYSSVEIGKFCNCCRSVVYRILRQDNIEIRNLSESKRKYKVNETFFDAIDTEEKAYILGLLYADGCNTSDKGLIAIALQEADKEILIKIQKLLFSNYRHLHFCPVGTATRQNQYRLIINSPYMSKQLTSLGCMQNKTFKLEFPEWLREDLVRHFIRGYFDGDGCISITPIKDKPTQHKYAFNVVGTEHMISTIQNVLIEELGLSRVKIHKPKKIYCLTYSGRINCIKIKNYLYKDANIYIERKHKKFHSFNPCLKQRSKSFLIN